MTSAETADIGMTESSEAQITKNKRVFAIACCLRGQTRRVCEDLLWGVTSDYSNCRDYSTTFYTLQSQLGKCFKKYALRHCAMSF